VPYTIQYPRCKSENKAVYLGSTLIHQLAICILTAIGFFVTSRIFSWRGAEEAMVSTMFMLSVTSVAFMTREFIRLIMLAELRVWLNLAMSLFANVATVTAMFIAYKTENLSSAKAYLIIAICSGIPALVITGMYWKKMNMVSKRILADFKDNFQIGKWLVARTFAFMGAVTIYPIALASFHSVALAGIYGACFQLASLLNPVFIGLNSFLRPKFSHLIVNRPKDLNRIVFKVSVLLAILLAIVFVVMFFVGNWAMVKLYGPDYDGYEKVLLVCILAVSASVLSSPISVAIDARKKTHVTFKGRMLGAISSLTLGLICVWQFGVLGAAIGLFVSHTISLLFWWKAFVKPQEK
jgi:O-antigen/teichoic acid export membrane protein